MNYTSTKKIGETIREICSMLNNSANPIEVAKRLPCTVSEYIVDTRFAFLEISVGIKMHKELVIQVIDKYVSNDEVRKVFFTHPFFKSEESRIDYIDENVGPEYCLIQKMRCDY